MRKHMSFSVAIYIEIKVMTLVRLTATGCSTAPNPTAAGGRSREGEEVQEQGVQQTLVKMNDYVPNGERLLVQVQHKEPDSKCV